MEPIPYRKENSVATPLWWYTNKPIKAIKKRMSQSSINELRTKMVCITPLVKSGMSHSKASMQCGCYRSFFYNIRKNIPEVYKEFFQEE